MYCRKHRSAFDQVSEFNRGGKVGYRDCGLSLTEIGSRGGRNQTTVMRICDRWMQEDTTDRRGRSHPPQCTTSREVRLIICMSGTDRSVTSRTIAQHIESVTHHLVSAPTIRRCLQQSGLFARRPLLGLPLMMNRRHLHRQWCDERRMTVTERNEVFLLTSRVSVCHTTMVGFESGDTVERGCSTAALCTATLVLHFVLWYGDVLNITLALL
ncbi:transposable element Tcb1 transposase [Trichonephila clavipes]|nr:transposable element Tcb1 transposase [Trichonephila clavipes]